MLRTIAKPCPSVVGDETCPGKLDGAGVCNVCAAPTLCENCPPDEKGERIPLSAGHVCPECGDYHGEPCPKCGRFTTCEHA